MIESVQKLTGIDSAVKLAAGLEELSRGPRLSAGTLLPPVRALAATLGVSPGLVAAAYRLLRQRGVVTSDGRRGTRVVPRPAAREYLESPAPAGALDLQVANPDPSLLPALAPVFAALDPRSEPYGGRHVEEGLLSKLQAGFLADGVDATHCVVLGGAIAAIHRGLRACLSPGDKVAVEDPGFNEHHAACLAHGLVPVPVALDDHGPLPESLEAALRGGARGVVLTARMQSPTGALVSKARAAALRAVLARYPEAAVLVDDYGAFLCDEPYEDCVGPHRARFLVVRSFNKAIAPDLRVAVAAADASTAERIRREQWLADGWVSIYLQRLAAGVLASRAALAQLGRARQHYRHRREALLAAVQARGIEAHGKSGLNVWIPVSDEAEVMRALLARGYCVRPGARYRLRSGPAIRVTCARLAPEQATRLADVLLAVLRPSPGLHAP